VSMSPFHRFTHSQQNWSQRFDQLLPAEYGIDGNSDFLDHWIAPYIAPEAVLYDIGGGKNPVISLEQKRRLGLRVIGLDIDGRELAAAPAGVYDETICADVTRYKGQADADVVICQALLEHVRDVQAAVGAIGSILKPGGTALLFLPSRNAVFARINLLLPEWLKRRILYAIFPATKRDQGFPAFYNRCTPRDFRRIAENKRLSVEAVKTYFRSGYFSFFFPLHVLWRIWILVFRSFSGEQAAETFAMALRKPASPGAYTSPCSSPMPILMSRSRSC
jgi:SAM-dependent methyltransferase